MVVVFSEEKQKKDFMKTGNLRTAGQIIPGLAAFRLMDEDAYELIHLSLGVGQRQEMHTNPLKVLFYVIKGQGQLSVIDEIKCFETGECVEVEPEILRSWKNISEEILELLVIKFK